MSSKLFNLKIVFLFLVILILFPVFIMPHVITVKAQSVTDITVQTAYEMINNKTQYPNLILLDVREQYEYDENHLCNATLIPRLEIDTRISELEPYRDTEIIVYCRSGVRSTEASQNLVENHNFTKIYNMLGGIIAWNAAGYSLCTGGDNEPTIDFNLITFSVILFSIIVLITTIYKKKIKKN